MMNTNYTEFTVREFIDDPDFLRYIKYSDPRDVTFWMNWKADHPEMSGRVDIAELQLKIILSPAPIIPSTDFEDKLFRDIEASIGKIEVLARSKRNRLIYSSGLVAALSIVLFGIWFFNSDITVNTGFGQVRSVKLSDDTEIVINSNSTISYPRAYKYRKIRTVSVQGEAYFKVTHLARNTDKPAYGDVFVASTKSIEVRVLGTEFNVWSRRGKSRVGLVSGSIELRSKLTGKKRLVSEGEVVDVDNHGQFLIRPSQAKQITAWKEGKLLVSQTTVKEILAAFEDSYGYKVVLEDTAMAEKKIDGSISIKSEQGLLFTLSNILDVNVKKEGNTIFLLKRK